MQKAVYITYGFFAFFVLVIVTLNLVGYITFGYGLGDVHLLTILLIKFALITIFFVLLRRRNKKNIQALFLVAVAITTVFILLKISIFRSKEHPWDGKIFVASAPQAPVHTDPDQVIEL